MPVSARGFALFTQQDIGPFRKGLELYHKLCISAGKIRLKLQLAGFSYDKKRANVVMWKDKEYEYISSAWNKQQQRAYHSSLATCQPNVILNNHAVWERLLNQYPFKLDSLVVFP